MAFEGPCEGSTVRHQTRWQHSGALPQHTRPCLVVNHSSCVGMGVQHTSSMTLTVEAGLVLQNAGKSY